MRHPTMFRWLLALLLILTALCVPARPAHAQDVAADSVSPIAEDPRDAAKRAQARFESFRRANLTTHGGAGAPRDCQERVGRFCYWYDSTHTDFPEERQPVRNARGQLIRTLDSLAKLLPTDEWISGQRLRYLDEAGRGEDALAAARECRAYGWWCGALEGLALHQLGRYAEAEAVWDRTLAQMSAPQRCMWTDMSLYLDDDTRRLYARNSCGTPQRDAFEARTWWLARTRYGLRGNDSRSEHFARLTYAEIQRDATTLYQSGFDEDERELMLRFGWPRAWARSTAYQPGGVRIDQITGFDPTPAYRFIPPYYVTASPVTSDSTDWALQLPPVVARYQPPYAKRLLMLEHQQGLFRRGDTALVVVAYDISRVPRLGDGKVEAALVATPAGVPRQFETLVDSAPRRGTLMTRAPWGPLLMSAEVAVPANSTLVRARYGIRPPMATGTRVSLSDLLFYDPYGEFPTSVEEALPHAIPTQRVSAGRKLGVFFEAYGTDPNGEKLTFSLTVVPETQESGALSRARRALRMSTSQPVSITIEDLSARGSARSVRALELDISTLRAGEYLVQLEVSVAGQYVIRTDRRLVVIGS